MGGYEDVLLGSPVMGSRAGLDAQSEGHASLRLLAPSVTKHPRVLGQPISFLQDMELPSLVDVFGSSTLAALAQY